MLSLFLAAPPAAVMLALDARGVKPGGVASTTVGWLVTVM